ncbi:NERD domain-containing protein [Arenibaculum pallidiluteum]|uniref:NERD domain-containing protein n=1 Tax=Arenibaculum pallidiluteum TaxID=2812559 RepID=UPI001A97531D|nr:hypothetical protein [Arenibaculum pallidiluteum]
MDGQGDFTYLLTYGAFLVLGLLLFYVTRSPSASRGGPMLKGERLKLGRTIDALQHPCHHDVRIVDQQGRIICIEHIVRLPASILLVGTVAMGAKGEIRGSEYHRQWAINYRGRATPCVNPLLELEPLIRAFRRRFPLVRVRALIVFPDTVTFPEGAPKGAVRASDFDRWVHDILKIDGTPSQAVESAWPQITTMVESSRKRIEQARKSGAVTRGVKASTAAAAMSKPIAARR